ncbi:MAG: tRNA pseudouridine(55) synthase TruB, partial [Hyphomicrobiales bacterium]|nr:tRNA pseudouridine(55) synthase TruB [Hyphomicrobiales bacterium]
DLGRALGCLGHVTALRRLRVGPFDEARAVALASIEGGAVGAEALLPVVAGLASLPRFDVDQAAAASLRQGRAIFPRGQGAPAAGPACAVHAGAAVAIGETVDGAFRPTRVFAPPR